MSGLGKALMEKAVTRLLSLIAVLLLAEVDVGLAGILFFLIIAEDVNQCQNYELMLIWIKKGKKIALHNNFGVIIILELLMYLYALRILYCRKENHRFY